MTLISWPDMLAQDERDLLVQVVVVLALLGLSLLSWLAQKLKGKLEPPPSQEDRQEHDEDWIYVEGEEEPVPRVQEQQRAPAPRRGGVAEVVQAMREAARRQAAQGVAAQVASPPPAPGRVAQRPTRPISRPAVPKKREEPQKAAALPQAEALRELVPGLLTDRDEARRGIVLGEILSPPLALRRERPMWEK